MGYKRVVTKRCSECGEVQESKAVDYCDGCVVYRPISQDNYDKHIRVSFMMKEEKITVKHDMVFHNLQCFIEHIDDINMEGVDNISINYISPEVWEEFKKVLIDG